MFTNSKVVSLSFSSLQDLQNAIRKYNELAIRIAKERLTVSTLQNEKEANQTWCSRVCQVKKVNAGFCRMHRLTLKDRPTDMTS